MAGRCSRTYRHWELFLAKNGFAVFAVSYRLSKPGAKTFPGAVYDVKAAVQFARANAAGSASIRTASD
jgi:acetyl esterase/lipase